jgi:serine/threonine-protein kinase HSL1, negative regulator of Swe1 kinase
MDRQAKVSRSPSRRPALAEKQARAQPAQSERRTAEAWARNAPSMSKPDDLLAGSSPRMLHHESLLPEAYLGIRNNRGPPPPAPAPAAENKRISAVANEGQTNSNRNSAISTTSTVSVKSRRKTHVGPWQLGRTLGKGATGRVRLAKHAITGQAAAIKIVSKKSAALVQSASMAQMDQGASIPITTAGFRMMPFGIEREVVIMKLIEHPNVIRLYDVWENRGELYVQPLSRAISDTTNCASQVPRIGVCGRWGAL